MTNYPDYRKELAGLIRELRLEIPDTMKAFAGLHRGSMSEGALNVSLKELVTLGISIAIRCKGCIAFHVHDALRAGATHQEILETIGVAIYMGGGPSVMYACEALKAVKDFEEKNLMITNPN